MNGNSWKICGYLLVIILIIIGIVNLLPLIIVGGVIIWLIVSVLGYIRGRNITKKFKSKEETNNKFNTEFEQDNSEIKIDKSNVIDVDYTDVK
ncbi:MAG: hypothetical protein SOZ71_01255 [Clostridium sp.]|nr:hypothetical protein [Clostridium sp.]